MEKNADESRYGQAMHPARWKQDLQSNTLFLNEENPCASL